MNAPHDPRVAQIAAYRAGLTAYHSLPGEEAGDHTTYDGPMEVLLSRDGPALTREGAVAALRLDLLDAKFSIADPVTTKMIGAALGYLERH